MFSTSFLDYISNMKLIGVDNYENNVLNIVPIELGNNVLNIVPIEL